MSGIIGGAGSKSGVIKSYAPEFYMSGGWAMYDGNKDQGSNWHFIASAVGSGNWPAYDKNFESAQADSGTYPSADGYGIINDMYKRFDSIAATEILFMTGDQSRWFITELNVIQTLHSLNFRYLANSGNLGHATEGNIMHRANGEDPWIDATNSHTGSHIFWGENSNSNYISSIKNTYGGIFVFVK